MRNQQHDPCTSHDAGTHRGRTAVPGWAISCCGSDVEGGRAVSVVSAKPQVRDRRTVSRIGLRLNARSRTIWAATFADQIARTFPIGGPQQSKTEFESESTARDVKSRARPLFVSRRGQPRSGVLQYPEGKSLLRVGVLRGVGRYLGCRETPGQRRARSRARLLAASAPLSERSRAVGWLHTTKCMTGSTVSDPQHDTNPQEPGRYGSAKGPTQLPAGLPPGPWRPRLRKAAVRGAGGGRAARPGRPTGSSDPDSIQQLWPVLAGRPRTCHGQA